MLGEFRVHGLHCAEEVAVLRRELQPVQGIHQLRFDVAIGKLSIDYDESRTGFDQFRTIVSRTGMSLEPWSAPKAAPKTSLKTWLPSAICGLAILAGMIWQADTLEEFFTAFLAHSHGDHGDHDHEHAAEHSGPIFCFAFAILIGAWQVAPKALTALRMRRADMNLLVLLSMFGAAFLGEWSEGAMLAFLFSLAGLLEGWSIAKAQAALGDLGRLQACSVCVVHSHGDHDHEHHLPVSEVHEGARIRIRPGERIACDGEVLAGHSNVDESIITGESLPVEKTVGARVISGSINGGGVLEVRVVGQPQDHMITRMERLVADASAHRKAKSEQFVERMSVYYTPAVLAIAALVLLAGIWSNSGPLHDSAHRAMLVLLVACPCALVISTPVTITAALASAASAGVIIKGGAALEEAARLKAVVFDKTGVLTQGQPEVREFRPINGHPVERTLERLIHLEAATDHPIAQAVVRYGRNVATTSQEAPTRVQAVAGRGVESVNVFWAGNRGLLQEKGLAEPAVAAELRQMESAQYTAFVCGDARAVWAVVGLQDPLRPEAQDTIRQLRSLRPLHLAMLTGDNKGAAAKVQQQLNLDEVHAELLPEQKSDLVTAISQSRGSVAMVGDGWNDAPAIASANLGIALGSGATGAALEAADVVIAHGGLTRLPLLLQHATRATRIIHQNVGIALGLKALFLLAAFNGSATLWMAIAADVGATVLVIFNGLRMIRPTR
ncbi:cadmium transporter [Bryobacterales bacterium F-183]|nr:cadmium transporter [Bryobacterales bacterium F-183]